MSLLSCLSGTLSDAFGDLSSLVTLEMGYNSISGSLPESLWTMTTLEILELAEAGFYGEYCVRCAG
jgi:hypothetical protein